MAASNIFEKSIPELEAQMRNGSLTSEQLTRYYLRRIQVYDGCLNSMITINPAALEVARQKDAEEHQARPSVRCTAFPSCSRTTTTPST